MKTVLSVLMVLIVSGCASTAVYKGSEEKVQHHRAIQARQLGAEAVGIGVDLTALDVLTERPLMQLGAAAVDAGILYGAYEGIMSLADSLNDDDKSSHSDPSTADTVINVDGSGNTISVDRTAK